jgi:hypothetical protein
MVVNMDSQATAIKFWGAKICLLFYIQLYSGAFSNGLHPLYTPNKFANFSIKQVSKLKE